MMRILFTMLLLGVASLCPASPLLVSYIEKPPYYYTEKGRPEGFLLDLTRDVFAQAGVRIELVSKPAQRVLYEIERNVVPACSIGWFKNPQRAAFAHFSAAIYQDKPMAVVTVPAREPALRQHATLRELINDNALRLGVISGYSYGPYIDDMLRDDLQRQPGSHIERVAGAPSINLLKLALGRIDYTLMDGQEFEFLLQQSGLSGARLMLLDFPDIPSGNSRYLMCSKKVDPALIERFNTALQAKNASGSK